MFDLLGERFESESPSRPKTGVFPGWCIETEKQACFGAKTIRKLLMSVHG